MTNAPTAARPQGWDEIEAAIDFIVDEIHSRLRRGMEAAAPMVQAHARGTTSYNNQTTATRNSTVAFVEASGEGRSDAIAEAQAIAEALNPGHADPLPPDLPAEAYWIALTVLSATDYSEFLNVRNGGASMYLDDALFSNVGQILDMAYAEVRGLLGG